MDEEGDLSSARPQHGTHQGRNGASVPALVVRKGLHPEQEGANGTDVTMGSMRSFGPLAPSSKGGGLPRVLVVSGKLSAGNRHR
jgi:hypothetical protein